MSHRIVSINADVPKKLVELICAIRYDRLQPDEGAEKLRQLESFVDSRGFLPRRRQPIESTAIPVPAGVPDQAIAFVNQYDYTSVKPLAITMAMPLVKAHLKNLGLM